ncbi:hypothetical protein LXL04_031478 [Taraxacum kok-saghyz]
MSTSPYLTTTQESKEDADYNKICMKFEHLMETIPKGNGWREKHLYNYNGFWLHPNSIKNNLILHTYFKSQPSDIFLASAMKSGTTWLKALMFSTINRHRYSFSDHPLLHHGPHSSFPLLDFETHPITDFTHLPSPRLFATHFPRTLLPSCITYSCKFVYVCRDPKDVLISKWHFMSNHRSKDLPPLLLEDAFELFCEEISDYGPFWEHVLSYWRASLEFPEKTLFLKYEEIKEQPELCSFENLSNLEVNKKGVEKFGKFLEVENRHYFRKGKIGDWRNYLSEEMRKRIDGITHDKLKGSGLILGASFERQRREPPPPSSPATPAPPNFHLRRFTDLRPSSLMPEASICAHVDLMRFKDGITPVSLESSCEKFGGLKIVQSRTSITLRKFCKSEEQVVLTAFPKKLSVGRRREEKEEKRKRETGRFCPLRDRHTTTPNEQRLHRARCSPSNNAVIHANEAAFKVTRHPHRLALDISST